MNNPKTNTEQSSSRFRDFKYQIPLKWYFQPIRDHVSCFYDVVRIGYLFLHSSEIILLLRPWTIRQVRSNNFFFWRSKNWTESENNTSALCNFFHHHLPRDISGVWTLSPLMKFTYTNSQQPHTQGLLKCAVYGLKYYGWATREKLYHSYPTTDTSLVLSHYETEPSASRI